ncbi:hypothetical protein ABZY09_35105 [Streptomyces sp. NPDC002928]|uniref:hypothetical protein n=1 Tax=Streptomyces sp. NPDC002928 TaxID=3154440 RepID=UPI00339E0DD8
MNSGYAYDAFGRTTTSGDTTTSRNTWTLDAAGRLAVRTAQTQAADGTWTTDTTTTNHYR